MSESPMLTERAMFAAINSGRPHIYRATLAELRAALAAFFAAQDREALREYVHEHTASIHRWQIDAVIAVLLTGDAS